MYKRILSSLTVACIAAASFQNAWATDIRPPMNLDNLKAQIVRYHQSGAYEYDISQVASKAQRYLKHVVHRNQQQKNPDKLALVLDIDETSLSNYAHIKQLNFGGNAQMQQKLQNKGTDQAIEPTLRLYKYAINNGITVFFITGRQESSRKPTLNNLKAVGYNTVKGSTEACETKPVSSSCLLYMRQGKFSNTSAIPYKSTMRKRIENAGYTIVANIGDQYSDLAGGYSQRTFKYPNHMYYIP